MKKFLKDYAVPSAIGIPVLAAVFGVVYLLSLFVTLQMIAYAIIGAIVTFVTWLIGICVVEYLKTRQWKRRVHGGTNV